MFEHPEIIAHCPLIIPIPRGMKHIPKSMLDKSEHGGARSNSMQFAWQFSRLESIAKA